MSMAQTIDKQLQVAIDKLNNKQKKAVLGIAKAFVDESEQEYDHWKDESFVAEMNQQYNDYKSGKLELVSLDDAEKNAREAVRKLKSKKNN